jgi:hypothetical protein
MTSSGVFKRALDRFFGGEGDGVTLERLSAKKY